MKSRKTRLGILIFTCIYIVRGIILVSTLTQISHPISLGVVLIVYSLLVGRISIFFRFPWFFYLLVLVFLGGVIVLIIYIRTLSANEKFIIKSPSHRGSILILIYILRSVLFFDYILPGKLNNSGVYAFHVYEYSRSSLTVFLIRYLLLTIIRVVKLVKFEKGPLVARL
jgi:hypothetical protein